MTDNLYLALAAILLLPMIPAFILYKFLPVKGKDGADEVGGETGSIGPVKSLSWKLKGAFAGYFLLVLVGLTLQYFVMNSKQQKKIDDLSRSLQLSGDSIANLKLQVLASANPIIDWTVKGLITPAGKDDTKFFYDDGTTSNAPDGTFKLIKRCIASMGAATPPGWICVYNSKGFRIVSLNREIPHPDIAALNINFDDAKHEIIIKNPIEVNSVAKDSIVAVANFIQTNPALKEKIVTIDPGFLQKAEVIKKEKEVKRVQNIQFEKLRLEHARLNPQKVVNQ
ncbi:MAG: hypothetical protein ABIX01_19635 [Chitinophagaceae bacterium]